MSFNYTEHDSWGNIGWLGTDHYYEFWGQILARQFKPYLAGKTILDIGAGNGRIWQEAFKQGLNVGTLHLIDPALNIPVELNQIHNVFAHTGPLDQLGLTGDVAVFKQSIHHIYDALGPSLFDAVNCPHLINFSMPLKPEWPLSPALMDRYLPSVLDMQAIAKQAGKSVISVSELAYPVKMKRDDWALMIRQRFTSILHDCDEAFLKREIDWLEANHPETLEFSDTLECLIIGSL